MSALPRLSLEASRGRRRGWQKTGLPLGNPAVSSPQKDPWFSVPASMTSLNIFFMVFAIIMPELSFHFVKRDY
jgi:hypothetical protein